MEKRYIAAIVVVIFAVLFALGSFVSVQSIDVVGCRAEWKTTFVTVTTSELCSSPSCTAQPADQQHNAIVDALLCACEKARSSEYTAQNENQRIEEVVREKFGYSGSASEFCEQSGLFLAKRSYG